MDLWLKNLIAGLTLYGGLLFFYFQNKWYLGFHDDRTRLVLTYIFLGWLAWTAIGAAFWIFARDEKFRSIPLLFFDALGALLAGQKLDLSHRTALLKIGVKGFFFPLMVHWLLGNFTNMIHVLNFHDYNFPALWKFGFQDVRSLGAMFWTGYRSLDFNGWYKFVFDTLIFIDVLVFTFAYAIEADVLKNKIRSVEPTFLGWTVALLCYPPINDLTGSYVSWHSNEAGFSLGPVWFDMGLHLIVLALFAWYVFASLSLGWRAGNLVNRGIVSRGAYRFTRHPAYFSKVTAWWIAGLPVIWSALVVLWQSPDARNAIWLLSVLASIGAWTLIYSLRAWTEERHLSADPDYIEYKRKVPWVAIPGVW